jgi:3-oxoacyl-[acyl-carrier protein] reductase
MRAYRTNVLGPFLFIRECAKVMKKNRVGRIVNFSTTATQLKLQGESVYASSKAAIASLTEILAYELSPFGITVNAVGPTPLRTDFISRISEDNIQAIIERQAIKRLATFSDVANVVDFFLRAESEFITGQVIYLGGC